MRWKKLHQIPNLLMALCRSFFLCSLPLPRLPLQFNTSIPSPNCPLKFHQITTLPLLGFKRCKTASFASLPLSSSMENPPEGYRRNVGICLMNPSNKKIFAASRLDIPSAWQMPQGGVDDSEDLTNAAIRELREETGVTSAEIVAEVPHWVAYDFPPDVREKLRHQWGSDWKGQAQKCLNSTEIQYGVLGSYLSSLGRMKKSTFWVMAQRSPSLESGHGYHPSKLLNLQWISRSLFTRKFYLFFLNISSSETGYL